ncbi:MAG: hypothetical protein HYU59_08320 [Magnetospirillum gryphiswaldense]|nr:hypothetical protein [Magnetospirillum gryphiswaldense]
MKAQISLADVDSLKAELGRILPDVKSSHRVEAMARGLGWNTNAALRTELVNGAMERAVDNGLFDRYLTEHGFEDAPYDALAEAVVRVKFAAERAAIEAVMAKQPTLNHSGLGVSEDYMKTPDEREVEFAEGRRSMLSPDAVAEFMRAVEFLAQRDKRGTINRSWRYSSSVLRREAESFHERTYGNGDNDVANGMLIAAAIHLGFKIQPVGACAFMNIAAKKRPDTKTATVVGGAPKRVAGYSGGKTRVTAWRNMMIAAINAGLDQGLFGLDANDNRWAGDCHVYQFDFAGMAAIACVSDIGCGELGIHVAVKPTADGERHIKAFDAGLYAGDAFASGYLEREDGKWLQVSEKPCNAFRNALLPVIAAAAMTPKGYKGNGRFIM